MKFLDWLRSKSDVQVAESSIDWTQSGFEALDRISAEDIFLVGYPKSGNTWMQNLIAGLQFGIDTRYLTDKLTQLLIPNVHGFSAYKRLGTCTCFKSHFLPRPEYRRVIYIVRDGRDAMISYYHMRNAESKEPVSLERMIVDGEGLFPCKWHQHVEQWHANPFNANMLIVRYEDLHSDPLQQMKRISQFMGLERDDESLQRCIDGNSFATMQKKEKEFGWDNPNWNPEHSFVRKGKVGGYKDDFPEDLVLKFESEASEQLLAYGYSLSETKA